MDKIDPVVETAPLSADPFYRFHVIGDCTIFLNRGEEGGLCHTPTWCHHLTPSLHLWNGTNDEEFSVFEVLLVTS